MANLALGFVERCCIVSGGRNSRCKQYSNRQSADHYFHMFLPLNVLPVLTQSSNSSSITPEYIRACRKKVFLTALLMCGIGHLHGVTQ
jgi:hypothetical protein